MLPDEETQAIEDWEAFEQTHEQQRFNMSPLKNLP